MTGQVAHGTLRDQLRALALLEGSLDGNIRLATITASQAEAFIAHHLASGVAVATANNYGMA